MNFASLDSNLINAIANSLSPLEFNNLRSTCRTFRAALSRSMYARQWLARRGWELTGTMDGREVLRRMNSLFAFFIQEPSSLPFPSSGSIVTRSRKDTYTLSFYNQYVTLKRNADKALKIRGDSFVTNSCVLISGVYVLKYEEEGVDDSDNEQAMDAARVFTAYPQHFYLNGLRHRIENVIKMCHFPESAHMYAYCLDFDALRRELAHLSRMVCT